MRKSGVGVRRSRSPKTFVSAAAVVMLLASLLSFAGPSPVSASSKDASVGDHVGYDDGSPAAGVRITLFEARSPWERGLYLGSTTTDANGKYSFSVSRGCFITVAVAPLGTDFEFFGSNDDYDQNYGCVEDGPNNDFDSVLYRGDTEPPPTTRPPTTHPPTTQPPTTHPTTTEPPPTTKPPTTVVIPTPRAFCRSSTVGVWNPGVSGLSVRVMIDGETVATVPATGFVTQIPLDLQPGTTSVKVDLIDADGNVGPATVVDCEVPKTTTTTTPPVPVCDKFYHVPDSEGHLYWWQNSHVEYSFTLRGFNLGYSEILSADFSHIEQDIWATIRAAGSAMWSEVSYRVEAGNAYFFATWSTIENGNSGVDIFNDVKVPVTVRTRDGEIKNVVICLKVPSNRRGSPIGLDVDGSGSVERIDAEVAFDLNADGQTDTVTEWFAPTEGILFDTRIEGPITGEHLFGDQGGTYADGFEKLALLDANGDGQIAGAELNGLAVWTDVNSNGVLDAGEQSTLNAHRVVGLSTNHTDMVSVAFLADGSTMMTEDLWFPVDPAVGGTNRVPVFVLLGGGLALIGYSTTMARKRRRDLDAELAQLLENRQLS